MFLDGDLPYKFRNTLATFAADLSDWELYRESFDHCIRKFGRLDACFLNAGCYEPKSYW